MVELFTDQAILLKKRGYGDKDWIVTLFTETSGRIDGIAKGGRVSRKRFGGTLDVGAELKIRYRRKPHNDLVFLEEAEGSVHIPSWRRSWGTIVAVSYALELVYRLLPAQHPAAEKFHQLSALFHEVREEEAAERLLQFEAAWLSLSGWGERLDCCGMCGYIPPMEGTSLRRYRHLLDHYWGHLTTKPLLSRGLLEPLFPGNNPTHAKPE